MLSKLWKTIFCKFCIKKNNKLAKSYYTKPISKIDEYNYVDTIGKGAYAKVKLYYNNNYKYCAIKISNKTNICSKEFDILKQLHCNSIVKPSDAWIYNNVHYMVMPYYHEGDLFDFIQNVRFTENDSKVIFKKLIPSILYCHDRDLVHGDIKPENYLISNDEELVLTDFGMAFILDENELQDPDVKWYYPNKNIDSNVFKNYILHICGTPKYCAPEVFSDYIGKPSDIWSLGVILHVLLKGSMPFDVIKENNDYKHYDLRNESYDKKYSKNLAHFLPSLLETDPSERLTITEIYDHPWLNS